MQRTRDDQLTTTQAWRKGGDAHHDDLEKEDDKDAREGEARAKEEHQEEQRCDDHPLDILRGQIPSYSAPDDSRLVYVRALTMKRGEESSPHPAIEDGARRRERRSGRKLVRSATSRPDKFDRYRGIRQIRRQGRVRDRGRDEDGKGEVVERATAFRTRVGDKGGQEGAEGEDAEEGPGVVAAVG